MPQRSVTSRSHRGDIGTRGNPEGSTASRDGTSDEQQCILPSSPIDRDGRDEKTPRTSHPHSCSRDGALRSSDRRFPARRSATGHCAAAHILRRVLDDYRLLPDPQIFADCEQTRGIGLDSTRGFASAAQRRERNYPLSGFISDPNQVAADERVAACRDTVPPSAPQGLCTYWIDA